VISPRVLQVVDFTAREALFNMALDYHLFSLCESGSEEAYLRFYTWKPPALSLGYHEPERIVDSAAAREDGIEVVRRPTGGRVVLHKNDLTYCVVLPLSALPACSGSGAAGVTEIYRRISECLVEGLLPLSADLGIDRGKTRGPVEGARPCFASTSRYEITHRGRKVVGSAQRVGRRSVLQHGSIPVGRDYLEIGKYLNGVKREHMREEVQKATTCLEDIAGGEVKIGEIAQFLRASFARGFNLKDADICPDIYIEALTSVMASLERGEYPVTCEDKIT
jgi:lipoate-protein ligase A